MARVGRKRKEMVKRVACGQIQKPTALRQNEMEQESQLAIKSVAMSQPHRRGFARADDEWLAFAAGRFCRAHGVHADVYAACHEWLNIERRWQSGYGVPRGFEQYGHGKGTGPTEEQMRTWLSRLNSVAETITQMFGEATFKAALRLVMDGEEVGPHVDVVRLKSALAEMAVVLGMTSKSLHPFRAGI